MTEVPEAWYFRTWFSSSHPATKPRKPDGGDQRNVSKCGRGSTTRNNCRVDDGSPKAGSTRVGHLDSKRRAS